MTKYSTILFFILITGVRAQTGNVIIQINNELITSGLLRMKIIINNSPYTYSAEYVPGELSISEKAWDIIKQDSIGKFQLNFQYQTFKGQRSKFASFEVDLTKSLLQQKYLIINVYDFRKKRFERWYGPYTNKDYLVELSYPGSPVYVRYN